MGGSGASRSQTTGSGTRKRCCEPIVEIFRRLRTGDAYPGSGVGLAIVEKAVERHGGTVRVEFMPGEGATFVFTLTAAR